MTFQQAQEFLYTTGNLSRLGLERMQALLERLGHPERGLEFVHVAGTNGKGSVCAMLSSVLRQAGYKTGLYTSPHLSCITERMQVDGVPISRRALAALAEKMRPAVSDMEADAPTVFERITAMALLHFAKQRCRIVVWEVGLGGRLDATNVIAAPAASVITGISLEHTQQLGDTVEQIAAEKGGIIKPGCPTVLCRQSQGVQEVIGSLCAQRNSPLYITAQARVQSRGLAGQTLSYRDWTDIRLPLLGTYQGQNAALALETVCVLRQHGWHIPDKAVLQGMQAARWPARLEVLQKEPLTLLDGAHNPSGVQALASSLAALLPGEKWLFVMGVMADKDYGEMLRHITPLARGFIAAQPDYERALPSPELAAAIAGVCDLPVRDGGSVPNALALARQEACGAPVCIFGSLYQAGEVRAFFGKG